MIKFLFVGDLHIRGTNPRNRTDNYADAWKRKLREVWQLAVQHEAKAVLIAGDIFDLPDVANSVLNEAADVFNESPCPILTTAGNHDIPGYNIGAYVNTSLRLLERIVPKFKVVNDPAAYTLFGDPADGTGLGARVTFTPYSGKIDIDGYGYSPETEDFPLTRKIHVAHGMLLDHTPPFDRFTLVQDVQTTADIVLTGHDHTGFGVYHRADGKIFCNPGSLTRLSASQSEINRKIQVAMIEVFVGEAGLESRVTLIPITSAALGEEVLDRSRIEQEAKRQYAMESFAALIQTQEGERVRLDINQIVDAIAEKEGFAPEVVRLALEKIEAARMLVA